MKQELINLVEKSLRSLGVAQPQIKLDYPENMDHGDLTTNVALVYSKQLGTSPKVLAEKIVADMKNVRPDFIVDVQVAGVGFINFKLKDQIFFDEILNIAKTDHVIGGVGADHKENAGEVLIEYTDPNTFKAFHIGHIMSNTIGESVSRLIEFSGKKIIRICYPSDIGLHIAKSIWAMQQHLEEIPSEAAPIEERTQFLGKMYVEGTKAYDADPTVKNEIDELNQVIYDKSDQSVNDLYDKGRGWSLDHFQLLYGILGTKFDTQIFESEVAAIGLEVVRAHMKGRGATEVFEESDGAVVFKGEEYGLHTRVFINSRGLPTYETKDVGLNVTKFRKYPNVERSIVVTANEQNEYFKVIRKVLSLIDEKNGGKTFHIGHGMLRFSQGKMSSRTGNVITADSLIGEMKKMVIERIAERNFTADESDEIATDIAVGAIKYTILRQAIGGNVIFDSAASISFEGDSGPYLQYSAVRANSIIEKAGGSKSASLAIQKPDHVGVLEKLLVRFPDIAERANIEYAPQIVSNYLVQLAGSFNSFYAAETILDKKDPMSDYRVELTKAFLKTMTRGLWILGIKVPRKM
ncbi:MAG: arginine--tRNA ligase [Candidatus Taylorbacteria bacterium]